MAAITAADVSVRSATNEDLPAIWQLILDSYIAIIDSTHESFLPFFEKAGRDVRDQDLKDVEKTYIAPVDSHFWVATHPAHGVIGCVALKRINADEAELKRMAVTPAIRGAGVGKLLTDELIKFARKSGFQRIILTTINARAAHFYKKIGFVSITERAVPMPPAENVVLFHMVMYLADKLIRHVAIIGGTHGNERLGVELVHQWQGEHQAAVHRPSFRTTVLCGNPLAAKKNVRYVDTDLNRCFTTDTPPPPSAYEATRAQEVLRLLGPKCETGAHGACDFIIDMHSTTSNMGLSLVMNSENDAFARRVASALLAATPDLKLTGSPGTKATTWSIDSIAPSGVAIEVGPLAHGTVSFALLDQTRRLVFGVLDYIQGHNQRLLDLAAAGAAQTQEILGRALVFGPVSPPGPFPVPTIPFFERVAAVDYPRDNAGAIAGYISPALDGHDWARVEAGAQVFVGFDGAPLPTALPPVPYRGPPFMQPPPVELHAIFVGEAAYLEKGIALALCKKTDLPVY